MVALPVPSVTCKHAECILTNPLFMLEIQALGIGQGVIPIERLFPCICFAQMLPQHKGGGRSWLAVEHMPTNRAGLKVKLHSQHLGFTAALIADVLSLTITVLYEAGSGCSAQCW